MPNTRVVGRANNAFQGAFGAPSEEERASAGAAVDHEAAALAPGS